MNTIKIFSPKTDICVPFIIRRNIATALCQWTKQLNAVQTFGLFLSIIYQALRAHSFPQDVSDCGGVGEVGGGKVVALLRCFPMHDSVKRSGVPEADCQPSYRRRASFPLIDSGRGHTLTLSLHIKGSLREGESQWGYIFTATFMVCSRYWAQESVEQPDTLFLNSSTLTKILL